MQWLRAQIRGVRKTQAGVQDLPATSSLCVSVLSRKRPPAWGELWVRGGNTGSAQPWVSGGLTPFLATCPAWRQTGALACGGQQKGGRGEEQALSRAVVLNTDCRHLQARPCPQLWCRTASAVHGPGAEKPGAVHSRGAERPSAVHGHGAE